MRVFSVFLTIILAILAIVLLDGSFDSIKPHQPRVEDKADIEELLSRIEIDKPPHVEITCFGDETKKGKYRLLHVLEVHADYPFKEVMIIVDGLNCSKREFKKTSKKVAEIVKNAELKARTGKIMKSNGGEKWLQVQVIEVQQKRVTLDQCRKIFTGYTRYFYGFHWSYPVVVEITTKRG